MLTSNSYTFPFRPLFTRGMLMLVLFSSCIQLFAQQSDLPVRAIDSLIAAAMQPTDERGPGIAVYLQRKGSAPYRKVVGMANLEYGIPLTENSVFDLASVAKQFTGFAIAKLVLSGAIRLEDNVRQYLPEVPDFGTPITIAHLLNHTSGLRDVGELNGIGNFGGVFTATTALRIVSRQEALNFTPGTEHDYSNTGYVLLALIVERVTNESFVDWCQRNIFQPLNMASSFANDSPVRLVPNRAAAYYGSNGDFTFDQNNGMSLIGSSAVYSSLSDMERWMAIFSSDDQTLMDLMTTPGQLSDGTPVNYNFGLNLSTLGKRQLIYHSGSTPAGFRTLTGFLPEEGISLVILSNWGNLETIQHLAKPILTLLLDGATSNGNSDEANAKSEVSVPKSLLKLYPGSYLFNKERDVKITLEDGQLVVTIPGMGTAALTPRSSTNFFLPPMNSVLSFEVVDGEVSRIAITENEQEIGELRLANKVKESESFVRPDDVIGKYYSEELGQNFAIELREEKLYLSNASHGTSLLRQVSSMAFAVTAGWFHKIELRETPAGEITGFTINLGSRARNLFFNKTTSSN